MGERGPVSRPTRLKLMRGETHRDRLNLHPPRPRARRPAMPADMSVAAKRVWRRVMIELGPTGVITAADRDVLRAYCEAVARYELAAVRLEETGPLIRGAHRGELVKNPLHQIVRDNAVLLRAMGRELGLTPSAREGLRSGSSERADPLDAWMAGAADG